MTQKRIALVIGISNYKEADQLPLCINDVDAISNVFSKLNFDILPYKDITKEEFEIALTDWESKLIKYDVGLFYFSGHGAEIQGENFLFPIDAKITTITRQKYSTISIDEILSIYSNAVEVIGSKLKTNILILDVCRNNPFTKSWAKEIGKQSGLANISKIPSGTFIGFATAPGKIALAGEINNSPYTEAILKHISIPNESIDDVFTYVNATTRYLTRDGQIPFKNSSLDSKFYFVYDPLLDKPHYKSPPEIDELTRISKRIFDFASVLPFGISLSEVISSEYGDQYSDSVNYDDLSIAPECKEKVIKYYWLKISDSKQTKSISMYLQEHGLKEKMSDDSYIVYMFCDNKLVLISIRLFFFQIEFHENLAKSFKMDVNTFPTIFSFGSDNYHSFFALSQDYNLTTISIGVKNIEKYCSFYWYGEPDPS